MHILRNVFGLVIMQAFNNMDSSTASTISCDAILIGMRIYRWRCWSSCITLCFV